MNESTVECLRSGCVGTGASRRDGDENRKVGSGLKWVSRRGAPRMVCSVTSHHGRAGQGGGPGPWDSVAAVATSPAFEKGGDFSRL